MKFMYLTLFQNLTREFRTIFYTEPKIAFLSVFHHYLLFPSFILLDTFLLSFIIQPITFSSTHSSFHIHIHSSFFKIPLQILFSVSSFVTPLFNLIFRQGKLDGNDVLQKVEDVEEEYNGRRKL